jgi:hypothetical protein
MQVALPHPSQKSLAIPLVTLLLGAAGGATVAAIVADDDSTQSPATIRPAPIAQSYDARPQEGTAAQAIHSGPQAAGLSEKSSDPSISSQTLRGNSNYVNRPVEGAAAQAMAKDLSVTRPVEGAAVQAMADDSNAATALSEKGTDPSVQPTHNSNSLGSRP